MNTAVVSALVFLSVALNFALAFLVIKLLGQINSLKSDLTDIKKIASRSVKEAPAKKKPAEPKGHTPLYLK